MFKVYVYKGDCVLFVGVGQINQFVGKFLSKYEFFDIMVFNCSFDKVEQLAKILNGWVLLLSDLFDYQEGFDCLIVCIGFIELIIIVLFYEKLLQGDIECKVVIDFFIFNNVVEVVVEQFNFEYIEVEGLCNFVK